MIYNIPINDNQGDNMNGENSGSPYDSAIEDLKAKRDAIDSMITQLEQLKTLNVSFSFVGLPVSPIQTSTEITEDSFFNLSIADAAKKYLSMVRTPKTTKEIYHALVKGGAETTESSLYVLISREGRKGKDIVKVNKKWGLSEWYKTK